MPNVTPSGMEMKNYTSNVNNIDQNYRSTSPFSPNNGSSS